MGINMGFKKYVCLNNQPRKNQENILYLSLKITFYNLICGFQTNIYDIHILNKPDHETQRKTRNWKHFAFKSGYGGLVFKQTP